MIFDNYMTDFKYATNEENKRFSLSSTFLMINDEL
jgi:uncharacterized Fe-S radical SAM superfamily protein PflX